MRWKILLLVLLMTVSCASTHKIYQNGFPVPQESYTFCDMSSSFCANYVFETQYEESKESVYAKNLPLGEKITLPKDTLGTALNLWIRNKKGWRYRVVITGPIIPGATVRIQATIYLGRKPLFTTVSAYYKCRTKEGGGTEGTDR